MNEQEYIQGRGSQIFTKNPYNKHQIVQEHYEGLDEPLFDEIRTKVFYENPKKVLNKIESPDLRSMGYSINPYQGCEHGCIYCYARNSHQYWGYSAGLDFESKIIVKKNAAELLEQEFMKKSWAGECISVSGNTDCYQPLEAKLGITRKILEVCLKFKNPLSIITKNAVILRDLDLLKELAAEQLVHVNVTITSLNEELRLKMEPRTVTYKNRLKMVDRISSAGIPVNVMVAPIIPGLTSHEVPEIIKESANAGAWSAAYTIVRLNGSIGELFHDWLHKNYPDAAHKVWTQIQDCHGGKVNDSEWGRRMRGDGKVAESIAQLFNISVKKYMSGIPAYELDSSKFQRPGMNYSLF